VTKVKPRIKTPGQVADLTPEDRIILAAVQRRMSVKRSAIPDPVDPAVLEQQLTEARATDAASRSAAIEAAYQKSIAGLSAADLKAPEPQSRFLRAAAINHVDHAGARKMMTTLVNHVGKVVKSITDTLANHKQVIEEGIDAHNAMAPVVADHGKAIEMLAARCDALEQGGPPPFDQTPDA
jgi:hypothetical protein